MVIAISQRHLPEHGGMDALENSYQAYFGKQEVTLLPIPNNPALVQRYYNKLLIDAMILSGGGDIHPVLYGGNPTEAGNYSPERDETEKIMLDMAIEHDIPVLGICRGMERINAYFGGTQHPVDASCELSHDETRHDVVVTDTAVSNVLGTKTFEVNSYHRTVVRKDQLASQLVPFATAHDRTVEGFYHPTHPIAAIIWHPERETAPHQLNDFLLNAFLSRNAYWKQQRSSR